jgi:type VI secretion system protein VasI
MKRRAFAFILTALAAGPAMPADFTAEDCAAMTNEIQRKLCFRYVSDQAEKQEGPPLEWATRLERSPMDDSESVFMALASDRVTRCGWNRSTRIMFTIRCVEGETAVILHTSCLFPADMEPRTGEVAFRLDKEPALSVAMAESNDNSALGLWTAESAVPFIERMFDREKLTLRLFPYREDPLTLTFNIGGLRDAIKPLRQACRW